MAECKTIPEILEEVCSEICDNYCKYSEKMNKSMDDEEYQELLDKYCDNCPLNKLV